ncbi:MAG TPA: hypothetical protein DCE41_27880, partial [Cytophagales bacterium]|nr:hypothetical protein [Cytophagales bacterium]
MRKIGFVAILALLAVVACQPEEIVPIVEANAVEESFIVTSAEEVDAMLVTKFGTADLPLEDKLDFLSDYHAQLALRRITDSVTKPRGASSDLYVAVAQVFDGSAYFTDVATGDGST